MSGEAQRRCAGEGCEAMISRGPRGNRRFCDACRGARTRASQVTAKTLYYSRQKAQGTCTRCRMTAEPGCTLCAEHLTYTARHTKALYQARRAAGLCGVCGAAPAPGRKSCATCLARTAKRMRDRRDRAVAEKRCIECDAPCARFQRCLACRRARYAPSAPKAVTP